MPVADCPECKMKSIKVLGTDCAERKNTLKPIAETAQAKGIEIQLEEIEDLQQIVSYGVMSTPCAVIDGKAIHAGGVPLCSKLESWV